MGTTRAMNLKGIVLFIAASALALTFIACGRATTSQNSASRDGTTTASNDSKTGPTPTSAPATAPPGGSDAQTAVSNAMQLRQGQKAYRVRTASTTSMGGQPRADLKEYVAPDRIHTIQNGKEIIIIGKTMYIKKGGEWQNMGTQMSDMTEKMKKGLEDLSPEERADALKGLSANYKALGDEMLGGTATAVYEMDSKMDTHVEGVGPITTVTKYWIRKSDGLIWKEETNGEEAGIKVNTTRIYEYDPDIKIEAPV